ncbi:MAG TPA: hypothetical protein VHZ75_10820 [Solirubrobacteraceae bacterium]|jgi:hypothetical protein|nr:hypothetical protein [Solirubrobacteraceae bacterium]
MPDEIEEIVALALVFGVHLIGAGMLVWALLEPDQRIGWRRRWGWGRGGGDDGPVRPSSDGGPAARVAEPPASLPLAATQPSHVRLREPVRAADGYPRPARRPLHEPQPQRAPTPGSQRHDAG